MLWRLFTNGPSKWFFKAPLSTNSLLNGLQFRVLNMLFSIVVLQSSFWHETLSQTLQVQVLKESSLQCDQSCGSSGLFQELTVVTESTVLYLILLSLDKLLQQMWTMFQASTIHEQSYAYSTMKKSCTFTMGSGSRWSVKHLFLDALESLRSIMKGLTLTNSGLKDNLRIH